VNQNGSQPTQQLALRLAPKIREIAVRRKHRFLNDIRRIEPTPKAAIQLRRCEDSEVVRIPLQQPA
jgi:hypothetical protein